MTCADLVKCSIQFLDSGEYFILSSVVVNPPWHDEVEILPHKQDVSGYFHFNDVQMFDLCD